MPTLNDLRSVLGQRCGFEVIDMQPAAGQIRIVGRVPPNANSQWVVILHHLLSVTERTAWKVDASKFYFNRLVGNNQKRMFWSWRLIFQGADIQQHVKSIVDAINGAPRPARVELAEFPLSGAQRNHVNGKGAYSAETTPMVAHIANQARMGGIRS